MMVTAVANPLPSTAYPKLREAVPPLLILVGSLLVYVALRGLIWRLADGPPVACLALEATALAAAALLSRIEYADIPPLLRVLVHGIGIVLLLQIALDATTVLYGPAGEYPAPYGIFFRTGAVIGLLSGLLALRQPSFVIPTAVSYIAFRHQFNIASGIAVSETDYGSLLDIGLFVATGAIFAITSVRQRWMERFGRTSADVDILRSASSPIWACAVGEHLGNYFVSGWTKIRVGGANPLFWLLHNPTQTSILIGLERGDNPLASWPWLVQGIWNAMVSAGPVINLFVLGIQIASPLAISHRRVLMAFTLAFDFFHVAVYFTLGALFHFWIVVNILVFLSARRIDDKSLTPTMKAVALAAVVLGHFIFYTSHLGWLDGAKLSSPSFAAETTDGKLVPVPFVYFGLLSYSIAQTAMYIPDDNFQMRLGGNTYNPDDWRDSQSCGPKIQHHQSDGGTLETIMDQVRETDAAMRRHPLVKSDNLYYFYPHHMFANPLRYPAFNRLSIGDIARYHYIIDSVCLSLQDGHLVRDVRKHMDYPINVQH